LKDNVFVDTLSDPLLGTKGFTKVSSVPKRKKKKHSSSLSSSKNSNQVQNAISTLNPDSCSSIRPIQMINHVEETAERKEALDHENSSLEIILENTKSRIVSEMLKKFSRHLNLEEYYPNCRNNDCKRILFKNQIKNFCYPCYKHYWHKGELRSAEQVVAANLSQQRRDLKNKKSSSSSSSSPPILNPSNIGIIKDEMLKIFKDDLNINKKKDFIDITVCINRHCKSILKRKDGKFFCLDCVLYYEETGGLRIRERPIFKRERFYAFRSSHHHPSTFLNLDGKDQVNYMNRMIADFDREMMADDGIHCRNIYCKSPLSDGRKSICRSCYRYYLDTRSLRIRDSKADKRDESSSSTIDHLKLTRLENETIDEIENTVSGLLNLANGTKRKKARKENSLSSNDHVTSSISSLHLDNNLESNDDDDSDDNSNSMEKLKVFHIIKMIKRFKNEMIFDLNYLNCSNLHCNANKM